MTWKSNPASFFDLTELLEALASKPRPELVKLIGKMAMTAPESLSACGVKNFQSNEADNRFD